MSVEIPVKLTPGEAQRIREALEIYIDICETIGFHRYEVLAKQARLAYIAVKKAMENCGQSVNKP